ncbi:MAG: sugar transferase [Paracoccaceae bacterium]
MQLNLTIPEFFQGKTRFSYSTSDLRPLHWSKIFRTYKRVFDYGLSILMLPVIAIFSLALLILNPFLNPGPVFFTQERLGRDQKTFRMYKFRTMTCTTTNTRSATDGVEEHRITKLGRIMRKLRIDELPNFINVLRREMSVIGPRPDAVSHAQTFLTKIPHYEYRYMVKPGITGLAQIESGYAEGLDATSVKAHYDQLYVESSCGRLDVYIAWRTIKVMLSGFGAK